MTETTRDWGKHLFSAALRRSCCLHASANTLCSLVEEGVVEQREKRKRKKVTFIQNMLMGGLLVLAQSSHE